MKVKDILKSKGPVVFTIGEEQTIAEAMKHLVQNNIGVLLVINSDGKISGILSERDILRHAYHNPEAYGSTAIASIMTKKVIVIEGDDEIEYAERVMTDNRIRHLPVVQNKILVGLISIGDVVKMLLSGALVENKYMMDYISGNVK